MRPNFRSISGAALMLVIIPIFAGLLACMPEYVPLGNPERARIDEGMSGMWFVSGDGTEYGLIGTVVLMEPWDKRTWLVTTVALDLDGWSDLDEVEIDVEYEGDPSTYDGFVGLFEYLDVEDGSLEVATTQYKAWLVKLGGEHFMTWELRVIKDNADQLLEPWYWQDFRITERTDDRMTMHLIDPDFPPLKEAPAERRAWEKVVKKNVDDDALYFEEEVLFERVKAGDIELFIELVNYSVWREIL